MVPDTLWDPIRFRTSRTAIRTSSQPVALFTSFDTTLAGDYEQIPTMLVIGQSDRAFPGRRYQ